LGRPILTESGEVEYENDLSKAKFDVAVDVGPTSSSKRAATVRALTGMLQIAPDPETQQVLAAMAMMNMEGEGIGDVRDFFRKKLLRMGVIKPNEQEQQELAAELQQLQAQPDPQAMYLQAAAAEAQAKAVKAQADTEYTAARTEETRAKTVETLAGIERGERDSVLKTARGLQEVIAGPEMRQPPVRIQ
jgi:hypothetical protein